MADYIYMLESRLTPEQQRGVKLVTDVARAHEMNIYLAGGVVRDIISGASIRDLDFTVQGNALKLQKDLEKAGAIIQGVDENMRMMYLLLPGNLRGEIASAREEKYDKPGKPPEINFATINEDLRRRDFTMNAMALSLNPGSRGLLLDPFNGVADIEAKLIRVLHNYAFLEEPSRLIRAVRFMARLDYQLEERTKARFDSAKENDYMGHVNRKLLGHEIEQIAHEPDPLKVMRALEKEDWLHVLHPHWSVAKVDTSGLNHAIKVRQQLADLAYSVEAGPLVMYFITSKMNSTDTAAMQAAISRKSFVHDWKHLEDDAKEFAKKLTAKELTSNSQIWKFLSAAQPEKILVTAALSNNPTATRRINDFMGKWRENRSKLPFPQMAEMRITPDLPDYQKVMDEAFLLLLDNKLKTDAEIRKFLQPYSPPEPPPPPPPVRRGRAKKAEGDKAAAGADGAPVKGKRGRKPAAATAGDQKGAAMDAQGNPTTPLEKAAAAVGKALGSAVSAVKKATPAKASAKPAKAAPKKAAKAPVKKAAPKKAAKKAPAKKSASQKKKK